MSGPESRRFRWRAGLSCRDVDREAMRYFFNGLPKKRRADIRSHLVRCPRCRGKLEVFARVWDRTRENEVQQGK